MWELLAPLARGGLFRDVLFAFGRIAAIGQGEGRPRGLQGARDIGLLAGTVRLAILLAIAVAIWLLRLLHLRVVLGVLLLLRLNGGKNPEVVLGVLEIVFRHDPIALRIGVARKLQIFLIDMGRRAANLDLRAVEIVCAIQIVAVSATTTATAAAMAVVRALRSATASA